MRLFGMLAKITGSILLIVGLVATSLLAMFVMYKGSQPMQVIGAPVGMTYFDFMRDRIDAAKTVQPARCGWGMMLSLATFGSVYSVVYTDVAIHPDGFFAQITADDPDIPSNVAGAKWYMVPGVWWNTVERLSWSMLGKQKSYGCRLRQVGGE